MKGDNIGKMNDLRKATITTLEIAEMMETEHWKVLRKLEGRSKNGEHERGYIDILGDNQMDVTDFFIKSNYRTEQNKEMPCYEVTKLGCDFLANKFTGEKGVLFTARYVKRFHEMEHQTNRILLTEHPGEVARLINATARLMERQGSAPYKVTENAQLICNQYGIKVIEDFVKLPRYKQMNIKDFLQ